MAFLFFFPILFRSNFFFATESQATTEAADDEIIT
jgi:hypothetical protein